MKNKNGSSKERIVLSDSHIKFNKTNKAFNGGTIKFLKKYLRFHFPRPPIRTLRFPETIVLRRLVVFWLLVRTIWFKFSNTYDNEPGMTILILLCLLIGNVCRPVFLDSWKFGKNVTHLPHGTDNRERTRQMRQIQNVKLSDNFYRLKK